jgi:hypothetical protein
MVSARTNQRHHHQGGEGRFIQSKAMNEVVLPGDAEMQIGPAL